MRPIRITLHVENLGVIDESVDDSVGDGVVGEDLVEFAKRQIGGRDCPQFRVVSG